MDTNESKTAICAVFWILLVVNTTSGALLKRPKDYNVTTGQNVTLECKTDLELPVYWYFNNNEIFYGGKVSMSFQDMFKVTSNESGVYNLEITAADESYNGEYICGDDEGQGERRSARLYVTAPVTEPINASSDNVDNTSIIGIVVGVVAGIALLAITTAVGVYFWKKRSKNGKKRDVGEKVHLKSEEKENLVTDEKQPRDTERAAGEQSTETYVGKKIYEEKAIKLREGIAEDPAGSLPRKGHVEDTKDWFERRCKNENPDEDEKIKQRKTPGMEYSGDLLGGDATVDSTSVTSSDDGTKEDVPNTSTYIRLIHGDSGLDSTAAGSPTGGNGQNTPTESTHN